MVRARLTYLRALSAGLRGVALPYGYALVVWGSGACLIDQRGPPDVWEAALFVAGAVAGYGLLKLIAGARQSEVGPQLGSPHLVRAGAIQVLGIATSIGAAAVIARIQSSVAWAIAAFAATLLYIVVTTTELALLEDEDDGA